MEQARKEIEALPDHLNRSLSNQNNKNGWICFDNPSIFYMTFYL